MRRDVATPLPPRPSAADRQRVVRRLRESCEDERLSMETFARRLELAYDARSRSELAELVVDLPGRLGVAAALAEVTASISDWTASLAQAWRQPRVPRLFLPEREQVIFGRSHDCDCVLPNSTVSRKHAELVHADRRWWVRDLGSTNGTYVNGMRVLDEAEVRAGDVVTFGEISYRLVGRSRTG